MRWGPPCHCQLSKEKHTGAAAALLCCLLLPPMPCCPRPASCAEKALGRSTAEMSAVVGYAGGRATGPDGKVCYYIADPRVSLQMRACVPVRVCA